MIFHGAYNNSVCVVNVTHNYVVLALTGDSKKTSCQVGGKQVIWFNNGHAKRFGPWRRCWGCIRKIELGVLGAKQEL